MSSRGAYYVVAHGTWRIKRKKKPSAVFANIRNPRLAFEIAKQITQEMDTTGIYTTREIHFTLESLEKEVTDLGFKISYLLGGDNYIVFYQYVVGIGDVLVSGRCSTFVTKSSYI